MVPYEPEVTYWWPTKSVILLHTAIGRRIKVHPLTGKHSREPEQFRKRIVTRTWDDLIGYLHCKKLEQSSNLRERTEDVNGTRQSAARHVARRAFICHNTESR